MTSILFPRALGPKSTIGIVSPARWPEPEWLSMCQASLEKHGYKVLVHPQNYLKQGQLAGTDAERAAAIMDMFNNKEVDAILCSRGGANAIRIVDRLDYTQIKANPKPFVGFSDISLLLNAITTQTGLVTYHGPMAWNFANEGDLRTETDLFTMLQNTDAQLTKHYADVECVRLGNAEGVMVGGNLTRLELLMATSYDWSAKDSILFMEDVDEVLYKLDEKLRHLHLAGRFEGVRAIIVGEMIDIGDGETGFARPSEKPFGRNLRQVFMDNLPPEIPLCFNFPCGHGKYLTTFPIGARVRLAFKKQGADITFMRE